MTLFIDADACPLAIREILFRAAQRKQLHLYLIANQSIQTPKSKFIHMVQVGSGFDVADHEIVRRCEAGDLVVTSDIPLAAEVIEKGAKALSSRGELFTPDNIRQRLNIRDFMDTMRSSGIQSGGPPPLTNVDRKNFADHLDRLLAGT